MMYKDVMLAKSSKLYQLLVEDKGKDQKAIEKEYKRMHTQFKQDYPTCTVAWFDTMNDPENKN